MVVYCAQADITPGHCQMGMAGVVNHPDTGALVDYVNTAKGVTSSVSPPAPFGGVFEANQDANSTVSILATTMAPTQTAAGGSTSTCAPTSLTSSPAAVVTAGGLFAVFVGLSLI